MGFTYSRTIFRYTINVKCEFIAVEEDDEIEADKLVKIPEKLVYERQPE